MVLNLAGILIAALMAVYVLTYAGEVWRKEQNPLGAVAVAFLAIASVVIPIYVLYIRR